MTNCCKRPIISYILRISVHLMFNLSHSQLIGQRDRLNTTQTDRYRQTNDCLSVCVPICQSLPGTVHLSVCLSIPLWSDTQSLSYELVNRSTSQAIKQTAIHWETDIQLQKCFILLLILKTDLSNLTIIHQLAISKIHSEQCNVQHIQLNVLPTISEINGIILRKN